MAFLALLIGAVLIVVAIRNSHGQLLAALRQDVPGYVVWAAAIFGLALIGFVPGLKPVSRALLALVVVVIVLTNYREILAGFEGVWKGAPAQAAGTGDSASKSGLGDGSAGTSPLDILSQMGFDLDSLGSFDKFGSETAVNG